MNMPSSVMPIGPVITSTANKDIKLLRSLHDRKFRRQTGWFLAEGMRICTEALQLGFAPQRLLFEAGRDADPYIKQLITACQQAGGRVLPVTRDLLVRVSHKDNPQTVIAAYNQFSESIENIGTIKDGCWVALDRVRDPGNLGTIMRTADAIGAHGVILIDDCTDAFSVEAVRASMGAVFNIKICHSSAAEFIQFKTGFTKAGFTGQIIGTALQASSDYRAANWGQPVILLMGNEQAGLPEPLRNCCDQLIRMPMLGRSDSLNLAVATGICLYEYLRHQNSAE